MENLATTLTESAAAVAALGGCQAEIDALDDASLLAGMTMVAEHKRLVAAYELMLATSIARRSFHEFGFGGLARRNGAPTPTVLIQSLTGASALEAGQLAHLGEMVIEVENDTPRPPLDGPGAPDTGLLWESSANWQAPIAAAVTSGGLSLDAANSLRRGLGVADDAVTTAQLRVAAQNLVDRALAAPVAPEKLWRLARDTREALDLASVDRGAKERAALRYVRRWRKNGMCGGSWLLPDEDGGLEIHQTLDLMLATRIGGPRFPSAREQADGHTDPSLAAGPMGLDDRTNEQVLADGFATIFHNGLTTDQTRLPGKMRPPVRMVVVQTAPGPEMSPVGVPPVDQAPVDQPPEPRTFPVPQFGTIEGSGNTLAMPALEAWACEAGTIGIVIDEHGQVISLGREQRLFTPAQRVALAVRDGGCRCPGCNKPPAWTEAHHINFWARDKGKTDLEDGILLCRFHHMLFHDNHWEIRRKHGTYWLIPPTTFDPEQQPIEMPTKNRQLAAAYQNIRVTSSANSSSASQSTPRRANQSHTLAQSR